MFYIGLLIMVWLVIGFTYGIYLVFVSDGWKDMQEIEHEYQEYYKDLEHGKDLWEAIMTKKSVFIAMCCFGGVPVLISDIKLSIIYLFNKDKDNDI